MRTVSSELDEKQAFLTLTKPVSRAGYLAGKWLGIMGLNVLLLAVSGVGVFAFVKVLASAAGDGPRRTTSRCGSRCSPPAPLAEPVPLDPAVMATSYERKIRELRQRGVDPAINGRVG